MTRPLSTAAVLSAGGASAREVASLTPLTLQAAICAPVLTCACLPGDNLAVHRLLRQARPGTALVVDAGGRVDGGYIGELAAIDAASRGVRGLVVDGSIRDGAALAELGFPVFHRGFAPRACAKQRALSVGETVRVGGVEVAPGDQLVADCDGVLIVSARDWPEVEGAAMAIEAREAELRIRLRAGAQLADLLELPPEDA